MKARLFFLLCPLIFAAQNVIIPDQNFKTSLLLNYQINTNKDSEIQISEAAAYTGLIDCAGRSIKSLQGIEAFINLTELNCYNNQITSLDLTKNTLLKKLNVSANQLTALDVSKITVIKSLICGSNKLTNIDVSQNLLLEELWIGVNMITNLDISKNVLLKSLYANNNQLTALDLTNNKDLGFFICQNNQISGLDLSKNKQLYYFVAFNNKLKTLNLKNGSNTLITYIEIWENPELMCVEVDDVAYSNINWIKKNSTTQYSINCFLSYDDISKTVIRVYPNPVKNILKISKKTNIEIVNSLGQFIRSEINTDVLDLSALSKGIYFIILKDNSGKEIQKTKIIKE